MGPYGWQVTQLLTLVLMQFFLSHCSIHVNKMSLPIILQCGSARWASHVMMSLCTLIIFWTGRVLGDVATFSFLVVKKLSFTKRRFAEGLETSYFISLRWFHPHMET